MSAGAAAVATAATIAAVAAIGGGPGPGGTADSGSPAVRPPGPARRPGVPRRPPPPRRPPRGPTPPPPGRSRCRCTTSGTPAAATGCSGEFHRVQGSDADSASLAVRTALSGAPLDPDYRTDWPAGIDAEVEATGRHHRGPDPCRRAQEPARRDDARRRPARRGAGGLHRPGRAADPSAGPVRARRQPDRQAAGRADRGAARAGRRRRRARPGVGDRPGGGNPGADPVHGSAGWRARSRPTCSGS